MGKNHLRLKKLNKRMRLSGFTLLECLLALFLFSFIGIISSGYIRHTQLLTRRLNNASEKEWHAFQIQLENELKECSLTALESEKLTLYDQKEQYTVLIEFKYNKIVKSANNGYQPLLTKVERAIFTRNENRIQVDVLFENGRNHKGCWIIPKELEYEAEV
ncbi:competence type IV pilus minor pilin ComGF [Enterococcus sp. LJL128]